MSAVLLDTNVVLWLDARPDRVSAPVLDQLASDETQLLVSVVTPWEIVIKHGRGRLHLEEAPAIEVPRMLTALGAELVTVELAHVLRVGDLPHHHRDPFDRLLIAQAQLLGVPIVSGDRRLDAYDIEVMAA